MRRFLILFSWLGVVLLAAVYLGDFVDGMSVTRSAWLLIGPIDLLILPAFGCLLFASSAIGVAVVCGRARGVRQAALILGIGWCAFLFPLFSGYNARLHGLAVRARAEEKSLIEFHRRYRSDGEAAVASHPVSLWGAGYQARYRATDDYVEVWWGSALPKSWGFRVANTERDDAILVDASDACAVPATRRITVFIGIW